MTQTRGEKFCSNSKCKNCDKKTKTEDLHAHMTENGNYYLKGKCSISHRVKKLPYTEDQLNAERSGTKDLFKNIYKKVIKPTARKISKNPSKALDLLSGFGEAYITKDPLKAAQTVSQSIKYLQTGKGLYLYKKPGGKIWISELERKNMLK